MLTLRDLGALVRDDADVDPALTARAIASPTEALTLETPLIEVVRRLGVLGVAALPVVDAASGRVLGTVGRAAIVARYGQSLSGIATPGAASGTGGPT